jgi:hypothetical protein
LELNSWPAIKQRPDALRRHKLKPSRNPRESDKYNESQAKRTQSKINPAKNMKGNEKREIFPSWPESAGTQSMDVARISTMYLEGIITFWMHSDFNSTPRFINPQFRVRIVEKKLQSIFFNLHMEVDFWSVPWYNQSSPQSRFEGSRNRATLNFNKRATFDIDLQFRVVDPLRSHPDPFFGYVPHHSVANASAEVCLRWLAPAPPNCGDVSDRRQPLDVPAWCGVSHPDPVVVRGTIGQSDGFSGDVPNVKLELPFFAMDPDALFENPKRRPKYLSGGETPELSER